MKDRRKDGLMPAIIGMTGIIIVVTATVAGFFTLCSFFSTLLGFVIATYVTWLCMFFIFISLFKEWSNTKVGLVSFFFAVGTVLSLSKII